MARPAKQGIDYFPYDTDLDQDDKLGMIIAEQGDKGERLYTKLLCWIYKQEGYFMRWDEDVQLRFLRRYNYCGFSVSFIQEVVPRFIKWGLFDKTVFDAFHTLTSRRIQKTWLDASRKRTNRYVFKNIWLLDVIDGLQAEETQEKTEETTQSKVKETKVNQSKVKPNGVAPETPPPKNKSGKKAKNEPPEPHWEQIVKLWFEYYKAKFNIDPSFKDQDPRLLKKIVQLLKKKAEKAMQQWTEQVAMHWMYNFFESAFKDPWLKDHFLLNNLNEQFDKIMQIEVKQSPQIRNPKPELPRIQREINYLYDTFRDGGNIINQMDDSHFEYMLSGGLVLTDVQRESIKKSAKEYVNTEELKISADGLKSLQKRFGLIEHFKFLKNQNNVTVFRLE